VSVSLQFGELRTSGVSSEATSDGRSTLRIERIELRDVKMQTTLGQVSAAGAVLSNLVLRLRSGERPAGLRDALDGLRDRLESLTIGELTLQAARMEIETLPTRPADRPRRTWHLDPLAVLDGSLHADITDAAWVFDAHVTIPIRRGRIDFDRATVEHIGPDSSMGISPMGLYVDAPTGRHYLYLLSGTQVPGATFEQRRGLLPFSSGARGSLELQPFLEYRLSGPPLGAPAAGLHEMVARTRVSGTFQPGNGALGNDRGRVVLTGCDRGLNRLELSSANPGPGVVLRIPELAVAETRFELPAMPVSTGAIAGALSVRLTDPPAGPTALISIVELTLRDIVAGEPSASVADPPASG
jgi:hypothetical protein